MNDARLRPAHRTTVRHRKPPLTAYPLIYWLVFAVLMSRMVWYDLRTISAQQGGDFEVTQAFTVWTVLLIVPFSYYIVSGLFARRLDTFPTVFLLLIIYSTAFGIVYGNDMQYIAQDIVKYTFIPAMYFSTKEMIKRHGIADILDVSVKIIIIFIIIRYLYFAYLHGSFYDMRYGGVQELYGLCVLAAFSFRHVTGPRLALGIGLFLLIVLFIALGQKRTTLLSTGLLFMVWVMALALRQKFTRSTVLLCALLLGTLAAALAIEAGGGFLFERIVNVTRYESSVGFDNTRRLLEAQYVYDELTSNIWTFLFGSGGGATFRLPFVYANLDNDVIHSVHLTIAAMVYRHGLFGIFIYFLTFLYGLGRSIQILIAPRRYSDEMAKSAFVVVSYKVLAFTASLTIFGGVDDALIGVVTAIAVYNRHPGGRSPQRRTRLRAHHSMRVRYG